jgi:hypothetical protein
VDQRRAVAELLRIDDDLRALQLERAHQKVVGPVVLLSAAATIGTIFVWGTVANALELGDVKRDIDEGKYEEWADINEDGVVDRADLRRRRRSIAATSLVAAAHFGVVYLSSRWLSRRIHDRKRIDGEIRRLTESRKQVELELGISAQRESASALLLGRF